MAIAIVGCSADATGPSPTDPHGQTTTTTMPTTTVTVDRDRGLVSFADCMADQGVPLAEIPLDPAGRPRMARVLSQLDLDDRAVLDALETCGPHLDRGALDLAADAEMRELVRFALHDLVVCLRARGVDDFPEPVPDYDGLGPPFPQGRIPWTDPDLPRAMAECSERLS